MPLFKAGVAGPIPIADGRVVTAEQGPFEMEIATPHDEDLLERGVIVLVEEPTPPASSAPPAAPANTKPAGSSTAAGNADSGGE